MSLRPKTKRRLLQLGTGGLAVAAAAAVGVAVQLHRHEAARQVIRAAGMAAFDRGDYRGAAYELQKYLTDNRPDADAIHTLATARVHLPKPDLSHLVAARGLLVRCLEIRPDDVAAQHELLDVYQRLNFRYETVALADTLLRANPADVAALNAEWRELSRPPQPQYDRALAMAQRAAAADPADVLAQEATLELMARLHRPPAEGVARADALLKAHPGDPRFELVRGVAALFAGDDAAARHWLAAAAAALGAEPAPDPGLTLSLAAALDGTGQWSDAVAVLDRAAGTARPAPPDLVVALAERLWYAGQVARAADRLRTVTPDVKPDARLLGLRALLLDGAAVPTDALVGPAATAPPPAAAAPCPSLRAALSARGDDPAAAGWSALVRATDPAHPVEPRQAVALAATAARDDADSAAARFFLGRAYLRLGEPALALESLAQAAVLAPAWAAPRLLIATTLLDANEPTAALGPARAALDRDPASALARSAVAVIAYRTLSPRAAPADVAAVLGQVQAAAAADPADPRLPAAAVDLTARASPAHSAANATAHSTAHSTARSTAGSTAATAAALAAIARPTATPAQLYRLAAVAAVDHLDVTDAVVAAATRLPADTPAHAYDLALALAAVGRADRGRQLLAGHDAADWQLADLRFREATTSPANPSDPRGDSLADAWAVLADANPADVAVQRATLASPAAARNRPLIARAVDCLHALTGDEAVDWRLALARLQLDAAAAAAPALSPATPGDTGTAAATRAAADLNAVASSMAEVTRAVPHLAEPQVLWATALERQGLLPAATAHLRQAVPLAPDDPGLALRLARLLGRQGLFQQAADAVDPLAARAADLPPPVAVDVADVYRRAGDPKRAEAVLTAADAGVPLDATRYVQLAAAQAAAGDADAAAATLAAALWDAPTPETIRAAAAFHAARGQMAAARSALARLDTSASIPPVVRDVTRGQFEAAFGDPAAARAALRSAVNEAPDDPRPWAALAGFEVHAGQPAAALVAADRGLALDRADVALSALRDRARTLDARRAAVPQPLLDALAADPTNPAAAATLDALGPGDPAVDNVAVDAVDAVADVAARYPAFAPAQSVAVDRLTAAGRFDEAAAVATRLADAAPADPAGPRLLTAVWSAAGRPDRAVLAAQRWRDRSRAAPQPADDAIAAADLRLGRPGVAVGLLAPYVRDGTADPATTAAYARALATDGHPADADAVLEPLAAHSPRWRAAWLAMIADTAPTAADAAARIVRVTPLLSPGSSADRIAVASAWYTVGTRFADPDPLRRGLAALDPLSDVAAVPTDALVLTGGLHQQLGDLPAAEAAYRRALAASPDLPRAMNNLAWVIALRDGDLADARRLADRAAALVPADADLRATVGQVALKQGDVPAAADAFRRATRLAPRSAAAWAGLADAEARAGHTGDAAGALDRAEALLAPPAPPPSPTTAAELARVRAALGRPPAGEVRTVRPVG